MLMKERQLEEFLTPTGMGTTHCSPPPRRHRDAHRQATAQRRFLSKEQCRNLMVGIRSPRPLDFASFLVKHFRKRMSIEYRLNFQSQLTTDSILVFSHLCQQLAYLNSTCLHIGAFANRIKQKRAREFPGGPVVKTLHFHCRGHRFNLWSGN